MDADHLAHIVERQPAGHAVLQLEPCADRLLRQHTVGNLRADADAPAVDELLQAARFLERNQHAGVELLPDPRYRHEHGGRNFAHILGNGFGVLDEIEFGAGVQRVVLSAHALGNVAQRQKTHALVFFGLGDQRVVAPHRVNQPTVQMHRALGFSGGTRGIHQDRQVVGCDRIGALRNRVGMRRVVFTAELAQTVQADDAGVIQVTQAFHVEHDDLAQQRQARAYFECLVELLVVFDEQYRGARVFAQVMHLVGCVGRINAVGDAASAQDGQVCQHPFDDGVGQNCRSFTGLKLQRQQAAGDFAHCGRGFVPVPAAPDPQVFLAHPDQRATLLDAIPEDLRNRVSVQHTRGAGLDMAQVPDLLHCAISSSSSSSSAALRAGLLPSCRGRTP